MADHTLKIDDLKRKLKRYGVTWSVSRGKGSHLMFERRMSDGVFTFPIPTHDSDVKVCYVRGVRERFRLRAEDGVSDKEFYAKQARTTRGRLCFWFPTGRSAFRAALLRNSATTAH
ncbi:MAG: type II toxin-antitoxin system HicA family toxin [Isosphaeraceae bacterium]|nr:type II toxin-antitoxin system HicA family toxin [Isosphaeraceae bacterium]